MKIGIISKKDAEWLGMAASVAGGWVMIGGEWANASLTMDRCGDGFFAAIPDHVDVEVQLVAPGKILAWLDNDIGRTEARTWGRARMRRDLAGMRSAREMVARAA